jgi:hypothetical protein
VDTQGNCPAPCIQTPPPFKNIDLSLSLRAIWWWLNAEGVICENVNALLSKAKLISSNHVIKICEE